MKHRWIGKVGPAPISGEELAVLTETVLPGTDVTKLRLLTGGFRNHNYLVQTQAGARVMRVYGPGDRGAWKERRLAELIGSDVDTPKLLDIVEVSDRVIVIREFIEGTPLHERLGVEGGVGVEVAVAIGQTLAKIHRTEFDECGELDANLRITERYDMSGAGIAAYVRQTLATGPATERLGNDLALELMRLLDRHAEYLDTWDGVPVLTHGDFGPSNLIVTATGAVSVLDWEFGCSGRPALDFGNLLRPPLEADEVTVRGLAKGYQSAGGRLPKEWRGIGKLVDTLAWVLFASRPGAAEIVITDARARIADAVNTFRM